MASEEEVFDVVVPSTSPRRLVTWKAEGDAPEVVLDQPLAILEEIDGKGEKQLIVKSRCRVGILTKFASEGSVVQPKQVIGHVRFHCDHDYVVNGLCSICSAIISNKTSGQASSDGQQYVPIVHYTRNVVASAKVARDMAAEDQRRLLQEKKLVLVVDLDQTLIHTSMDFRIQPGIEDVYGFDMMESNGRRVLYHVRLRPHTREFLRALRSRFEMHVFTMGSRRYAESIADLLEREVGNDAGKLLFSRRILSRDELLDHRSKAPNLRALFAANDSMVVIIDDRIDVWENQANVVQVQAYRFWKDVGDINLPPGAQDFRQTAASQRQRQQQPQQQPQQHQQPHHQPQQQQQPPVVAPPSSSPPLPPVSSQAQATAAELSSPAGSSSRRDTGDAAAAAEGSSPALAISNNSLNAADGDTGTQCSKSSSSSSGSSSSSSGSSSSSSSDDDSAKSSAPDVPMKGGSESEISGKRGRTSGDSDSSLSSAFGKAEQQGLQRAQELAAVNAQHIAAPATPAYLDGDDYLTHLVSILCRVHDNFFSAKAASDPAVPAVPAVLPTTRRLVPELRAQTLGGVRIVFSGVIPTDYPKPEQHEAWRTAVALGAVVQQALSNRSHAPTTHLVAAKYGTHKVHSAQRMKHVHVVTTEWLWSCSRQWVHVGEVDFPLLPEHSGTDYPRSAHPPRRPRREPQSHGTRAEKLEVAAAAAPIQRHLSISAEERAALMEEVDAELTSDSDDNDSDSSAEIVRLPTDPCHLAPSASAASLIKPQKRVHESTDSARSSPASSNSNSSSNSDDIEDDDSDDEMADLLDQELTRSG